MGVLTNRSTIMIGGIILVVAASGLYLQEINKPFILPIVGLDVLGVDIMSFRYGRDGFNKTYKSMLIYLNNTGNIDLHIKEYEFSLTGWTIPNIEIPISIPNVGKQFVIELVYNQNYANVEILTEQTQWNLTLIFEPQYAIHLTNDYSVRYFP